MTFDADPYAVLGLPRGASLGEVKRAYRRLAKAFHPDAAGPSAMSRFLAIQAAYEQLADGAEGGAGSAATRTPRRPTTPSWQADADRARATRDGWRARTTGTASNGKPGQAPPGGSSASGPGSERRPGGGRGGAGGAGGRGRRRATPGSTSYDEAAQQPFDPEWSGASWYGQSSGTYWTINPREYADPRKHGPEYQARARRAAGADGIDEGTGEPVVERAAAPPPPDEVPGRDSPPGATFEAGRRPGDARPRAGAGTTGAAGTATWRRDPGDRPPVRPASRDERPGGGRIASGSPVGGNPAVPVPSLFQGPGARLAFALVGWPPLGLGLAWLAGEWSGCGRFSASCSPTTDAFALGTWLVQLVVIAVLLVLPGAAAVSAAGTVGMLAAAVPAAVVLSIAGGSYAPGPAAAALGIFLAVGYVGGVAFAILRRSRTIRP